MRTGAFCFFQLFSEKRTQEPSPERVRSERGREDKPLTPVLYSTREGGELYGAIFAAPEFIADDTLEGLAKQLGLEGDAVETFVAEIEKYNKFCEYGIDEDFGRYAEVLFPVKDGPFYALAGNPGLGEIMSTCGGIITNAEQNALDANFEPIPGLYVSGNDCGRRFGVEYITPTPGVSLGMAIVLGREAGKSVAKYLETV